MRTTKLCKYCGEVRAIEHFYEIMRGKNKDGVGKACRHHRCILCHSEYQKSDRFKKIKKASIYKREYGISYDELERVQAENNGSCVICGHKRKRMALDHCHATGKIRGWLCGKCNIGIGQFEDSPKRMLVAVRYLLERR